MKRTLHICIVGLALVARGVIGSDPAPSQFSLPTIKPQHIHMRQLVKNALGYIKPGQGLFDEVSGYPVEGWNDDDQSGLQLRGFTQLTTVGEWLELLAHIAAGCADQPYLSRGEALIQLDRVTRSLLHDQADPNLSDRGLLCNFIGFDKGRRMAPLASDAYKQDFVEAYGAQEGLEVWRALEKCGWVRPWANDEQGEIIRGPGFGYGQACFKGVLAPYASHDGQIKIMTMLDRRVVQVVFGDNANLSASVAKTIGVLLKPEVANNPLAKSIRGRLEQFLDAQRPGYQYLYDSKRGLFRFGWNATHKQYLGWGDPSGVWQVAFADYYVNEFRGPLQFVLIRFGFPDDPLRYQAFKVKSRVMTSGQELFTLGLWEGSAFQALGLSLFMGERSIPGWRANLENTVRINLDYSREHKLPGFLSEAYSGNGNQYSGKIGVPELTVVNDPRITNAPSIYTLGVAYSILPDEMESFLLDNWSAISSLFTQHGPWEGTHMVTQLPIKCQTAVHVMSLIVGGLGAGDEAMARYLEQRGMLERLRVVYPRGEPVDLLVPAVRTVVWSPDESRLELSRGNSGFRLMGENVRQAAVTWMVDQPVQGVSLSGNVLRIRYRNREADLKAVISLERPVSDGRSVSQEIFVNLRHTRWLTQELCIPLPATPSLLNIQKVTLLLGCKEGRQKVDLQLTQFKAVLCAE
ncbi:MAG: hypothetical protein WCI03_07350 [bacterium]